MDYRQLAYQTAQKYGIDPDLFVRQIQAESAFRPDAVSSAGAIGLGQLMPATAKELGVDPNDPVQNLEGAARYMKQQLDRFGDPALALAAYNAGPSRVAKANGVPNITETQNYVAKILGGKGGAAMAQQPQEQKPQGLLGGLLGGQGIGGALGLSPEFTDKLAMAVMAGTGDARLTPLIQQRAASMKERRGEAKEQRQRNKSLEFLKQRVEAGDALAKQYYDAVSTGVLPVGTGISGYLADSQAAPKTYQYQALAKDLLEKGLAKNETEALQMALSQTKAGTTVNVGPQGIDYGKPPTDMAWKRSQDGTVALDDRGVPIALPIAGTKLANEALKKDETAEVAAEQQVVSGGVVLGNIQEIREVMENSTLPTTGVFGQILRNIGGTGALDVKKLLDPIEAAIGFERLQAMRDASPTGGALGQVTERELTLLSSALGSLDQAQSKEQFLSRIANIESRYTDIIRKFDAYPPDAMAKAGYQPRLGGGSDQTQPRTDDDLLKKYGG